MSTAFETVIGLEVHVQLSTESKVFSRARSRVSEGKTVADEKVNSNTTPVCAGHPGTLPVLNKKAVEYAIKAGLATGCTVNQRSVFSRKHYFYPDLPKGYQISQFDLPLCEWGEVMIYPKGKEPKKINIRRIHMEEDAGKNVHMSGFSLVNLNRAGVPLIEIVSEPDMSTPEEASSYLKSLYAIVTYLGICDGNLQEGNFRCDVNVSVRPVGQKEFGTRTECKNLNSFRFVEKAIEHESARQIEVIKAGGKVLQETRLYDSAKNTTMAMRSKEEAHDYRYFPEPDLLPLVIQQSTIDSIKAGLPELPEAKRQRYVKEFGLSDYDAGVMTANKKLAQFFEDALELIGSDQKLNDKGPKVLSNYISGEVSRLLNDEMKEIDESKLTPKHLADLVPLVLDQTLSSTNAKVVVVEAWESGDSVDTIVTKKGLKQVSDSSALEPIVAKVIEDHPSQTEDFKNGKDKLLGFFVGQCMKASKGQGNPKMFQELVTKMIRG